MLNTRKALELAKLLADYIPEEVDENILDFIGKIVSSIKNSDNPENFAESVMLMWDLNLDEIKNMEIYEIIEKFISGLQENQIISLVGFYKWLM